MNILVTGANGQLGSEMQIVARDSSCRGDCYFFTDVCEGYERLDITDLQAVRNYVSDHGIGAIVNCAAWTNVDGAEDPSAFELVERLNATAPENLAIAMKEVGGLLVHISTDYVFGREPYNEPCREDQTGTPTGVYGLTKLHGEQAIRRVFNSVPAKSESGSDADVGSNTGASSRVAAGSGAIACTNADARGNGAAGYDAATGSAADVGFDGVAGANADAVSRVAAGSAADAGGYVIIRTAWLYSEFGRNFCKTMLDLTATKPELKVVFDQVGTPTYALDLAKAISVILDDYKRHSGLNCHSGLDPESPRPADPDRHAELDSASPYVNSGIYHYSNEGVCSWYDFTKMIQLFSGQTACNVRPCHSTEFPSPVARPAYSVLDKTKIKETFGVEVPYWTDSLKTCISNLQKS